jgi:hypothetical protein
VKKAIEEGTLRKERLETYLGLRKEIESQVLRSNPHEKRRQERRCARAVQQGQEAKRAFRTSELGSSRPNCCF